MNSKLPDRLNNVLIVIAVAVCLLCGWQIRHGGGAVWYVAVGIAGYLGISSVYQLLFRR